MPDWGGKTMSNTKDHHDNKRVRDGYAARSLDSSFPEPKEFLLTGDRVLDVGCGPGTITLEVGQVVYPGREWSQSGVPKKTLAKAPTKASL